MLIPLSIVCGCFHATKAGDLRPARPKILGIYHLALQEKSVQILGINQLKHKSQIDVR